MTALQIQVPWLIQHYVVHISLAVCCYILLSQVVIPTLPERQLFFPSAEGPAERDMVPVLIG